MNYFRILKNYLFVLMAILVVSCERNDEPDKVKGDYLYDYELVKSYTKKQVVDQLQLASFAFSGFDSLISSSEYGVDVYRVLYKSSLEDEEIIASGLVCIPQANEVFPFASFQNGTNTCHSNAPSQNYSGLFYSLISVMAGSGYIITIPDYIGFGESENVLHPYHHKQSSNASVVDLLLAAEELVNSAITAASSDNELYLLGYSQGGWATLSVLKELEANYANKLNVVAAACGAGAYNLMDMSKYVLELDEYKNPFYLPYFIESRRQNGILTAPLTSFFNSPYAENIPALFDGSYCGSEINENFSQEIDLFLKEEFVNYFETATEYADLRKELSYNSVTAWDLQANVRFYHSRSDSSVPYILSQNMYDEFISEGIPDSQVSLVSVDLLDHNDAIIPWGANAINWINKIRDSN